MLNKENRYLFKFAWKSIRRNAGRSFFIGFSVSLAVVVAIWVIAFFEGLNSQIERAVVNTNTGYYQLQDPLYARSTDSSRPRPFSSKIIQDLGQSSVQVFSPELVLDGNIATPDGAQGLTVLGVDPDLHKKLIPLEKNLVEGSYLGSGSEANVVIGESLAKKFKFHLGEQMVLNYQDVNGELRSEILTISGIYRYNSPSFEKKFVYITQKTWQSIFLNSEYQNILFNRITLITNDLSVTNKLNGEIASDGLILKTWKQMNPEMAVILEFHDGMIKFFFLIIAVTITMTILTPVQMLWQERFKELKMMSILGISVRKFWKIGIFEVIQMILLSAFLSSATILVIIGIQSKTGIDFRFLGDGVPIERAGIKLPGIIFPQLSVDQFIITFLFVVFVLSVSYLWSIYRTLRRFKVEI